MIDAKSEGGCSRLTKAHTTRRANIAVMNAKCKNLAHAFGEMDVVLGTHPLACGPPPPR